MYVVNHKLNVSAKSSFKIQAVTVYVTWRIKKARIYNANNTLCLQYTSLNGDS
jgi:hypothetical protein